MLFLMSLVHRQKRPKPTEPEVPPVRLTRAKVEPEYCERNPYRLLMQGLASIVRVAQCEDPDLALKAGQWLVGYGERLIAVNKATKATAVTAMPQPTRSEIISELRGLYAKALGPSPLIVDAKPEPAPEVSSNQSPE